MQKNNLILELFGTIPSKKNSRINTRSGLSFPSKKYVEWHNQAIMDIIRQSNGVKFADPIEISIKLFFGTRRRADIDNKTASIFDTLTDAGVIVDDDWKHIPKLSVEAEYREKKPGAIIKIKKIMV